MDSRRKGLPPDSTHSQAIENRLSPSDFLPRDFCIKWFLLRRITSTTTTTTTRYPRGNQMEATEIASEYKREKRMKEELRRPSSSKRLFIPRYFTSYFKNLPLIWLIPLVLLDGGHIASSFSLKGSLQPLQRVSRSMPLDDDRINPPFNVSIVLTSWFPPGVRVGWNFYDFPSGSNMSVSTTESFTRQDKIHPVVDPSARSPLKKFQIKYSPIGSRTIRKIVEVPSFGRNVTLDHLDPSREYYLEVVSVSESGVKNASHPVMFVSPANDSISHPPPVYYGGYRKIPKFRQRAGMNAFDYSSDYDHNIQLPFIKMDEAIIIVVVLCAWFGIIYLFCNKWAKIRHLEPYQPDYHKRESTDTEVIVDPFSSFSATHYNPKLQSRMNTLNTGNNGSISNFASIETNPGAVNFMTSTTTDKLSLAKRKASMSLNEVNRLDQHSKRIYSHGGSARFNYQSFAPRLYQASSTGIYFHRRSQDPVPHHPASSLRHHAFVSHGATYTTPNSINYSFSSCRPSFSLSSDTPQRRHSSVHHNPSMSMSVHATTLTASQADVGVSKASTPEQEEDEKVRHNSLLPLPPDFKLSPERKIKSAEDLKTLVLELTRASKRTREDERRRLIAETYQ